MVSYSQGCCRQEERDGEGILALNCLTWKVTSITSSSRPLARNSQVTLTCLQRMLGNRGKCIGLLVGANCLCLEKAMAPHSSTLAWKIPWTEEPGRRQSMGSHRVWHDWVTSLSLFTFMHWRRKWQPTPVFLPRESQGRGSLVGCCLWGCTESDTTEVT